MTEPIGDPQAPKRLEEAKAAALDNPLDLLLEDDVDDGSPLIGRICIALIAAIIAGAVWQSYGLGLGSLSAPGPGLWPFAVSAVTFALCIVLLVIGATWARTEPGGQRWVISSIAAFIVYCAILPVLGFVLASIPAAFFFTRVIGNGGWTSSIATGVLAPVGTYYIFSELLGVPLVGPAFM